jgi:dynein heavy chain
MMLTKNRVLFQECLQLLHADEESVEWLTYVDYVDEMLVDGFFNTIHCSLKFLLDNTVPRAESEPLFEAVLELQVSKMQLLDLGTGIVRKIKRL